MKPSIEDVIRVVKAWSNLGINNFPSDANSLRAITDEVFRFVEDEEKLRWFGLEVPREMKEWKGIAELRSLYARKYPPADRIRPLEDQLTGEARYSEREGEEDERRFAEYKRLALEGRGQ